MEFSWSAQVAVHADSKFLAGHDDRNLLSGPWSGFSAASNALVTWLEVASVDYYDWCSWILLRMWVPFVVLAVLFLPFGHKRPRCDHHQMTLFKAIRASFLGPHPCAGDCVLVTGYSWQLLGDDLAWSIWSVELGAWVYCITILVISSIFLVGAIVYACAGSIVLMVLLFFALAWLSLNLCSLCCVQVCTSGGCVFLKMLFLGCSKFFAVAGTILVAVIRQACREIIAMGRACAGFCWHIFPCLSRGRSDASDESAESGPGDMQEALLPSEDHREQDSVVTQRSAPSDRLAQGPTSSQNQGQDEALRAVAAPIEPGAGADELEAILRYGGPQLDEVAPQRVSVFGPLLVKVLRLLPLAPENAWGGVVGFLLGTHPLRNTYIGNGRIAEFLRMGWRRRVDLSTLGEQQLSGWSPEAWRDLVRNVVVDVARASEVEGPFVQAVSWSRVPRALAYNVDEDAQKTFTQADGLFNWDQYEANECWICSDSHEKWDLWVSCRHAFCSDCSDSMLRRMIPCPFCRTVSTAIVRRAALKDSTDDQGHQEDKSNEHVALGADTLKPDMAKPYSQVIARETGT